MKYFTRKIIRPSNLNSAGSLFGGQALAWLDEEAAISAMSFLGLTNIVTKIMSMVDFQSPAKKGHIIEIGTEIVKVGRTSISIKAHIFNKTTNKIVVSIDEIMFVCVGEDGPVEHGKSMDDVISI